MRMPFLEFITSGDLKFIIAFIIFFGVAIFHFVKKIKIKKNEKSLPLIQQHNKKINNASTWILSLSGLSLLLGLMHSFYFIGKAGGASPSLIFQGIANVLVTPVLGICLFMICKIFQETFNKEANQK